MKKNENIGGYIILQDFIVAGGMSKISFAQKGGVEYFIKEFLSPKYPIDGSPGSPTTIARKRKRCDEFELHHKKLNEAIGSKCAFGGNLVYAVDFFRYRTSYYKVTEKIDVASLSIMDISKLPLKKILIILKTVTHSLKILHDLNIVHGDLKPDNILIKKTKTGGYTTKLIDFDNSYFSQQPPQDKEEVVGTPEYYSPELAFYIKDGETEEDRKSLTIQSDIFALGLIFCEFLTGRKVIYPEKYTYLWEAVNAKEELLFKGGAKTKKLNELLRLMLSHTPNDRPTIAEVFSFLKRDDIDKEPIIETEKTPFEPRSKKEKPKTEKSKLKISNNLKKIIKKEKKTDDKIESKSTLRIKGLNTKR